MNVDDYSIENTGSTRTRRGRAVSRPGPVIFNDASITAHAYDQSLAVPGQGGWLLADLTQLFSMMPSKQPMLKIL